jgi:LPXTG-site transpeptidase (sortase) family protein
MSSSVHSRFLTPGVALFLTGFVISVTAFWLTPKNPIQAFPQAQLSLPQIRQNSPTRIQIGSSVDLPIKEMPFGPNGWGVASDAASLASTSARPGENGNIIIYSHNLKRLFGRLNQAKIGDVVMLTAADGSRKQYTVSSRAIVSPSQIDALLPTKTEILTLYTCTGLFDRMRLVVRAIPEI